MIPKPGSELDHAVAEKLEDDSTAVPAYSTDESLADPLLSLLSRRGVLASVTRTGGIWYATLSARLARPETIATGSGRSRALAICRAVANVSRWPDQTKSVPISAPPSAAKEAERRQCTACGAPIRRRSRRATKVLCSVCAWKEGKPALQQFEASRVSKSGRRRRPRGLGKSIDDIPDF